MATYIALSNFTDQGIRNVKDTTKRADAVKEAAAKFGAKMTQIYWTQGKYDVVAMIEAPTTTRPPHSPWPLAWPVISARKPCALLPGKR